MLVFDAVNTGTNSNEKSLSRPTIKFGLICLRLSWCRPADLTMVSLVKVKITHQY